MTHPLRSSIDAVVLDIEGTTTPISFVYDELFPYARLNLADFLEEHWHTPAVQADVALIAEQAETDRARGEEAPDIPHADEVNEATLRASVIDNLLWQMEHDKKTTGLKSLQGKIWRDGYHSGRLRGVVFDDVPEVLRALDAASIPTYIYSSGSIAAQKTALWSLHCGRSHRASGWILRHDDWLKKRGRLLHRHRPKYRRTPADVLFATDNLHESQAAREAGLHAVILDRPGNPDLPDHDFPVWEDLTPLLDLTNE